MGMTGMAMVRRLLVGSLFCGVLTRKRNKRERERQKGSHGLERSRKWMHNGMTTDNRGILCIQFDCVEDRYLASQQEWAG